jgi:hypothetical protein
MEGNPMSSLISRRAFAVAGTLPVDEILRVAKSEIVSAYPGWEHPDLIDWEINDYAAQPA